MSSIPWRRDFDTTTFKQYTDELREKWQLHRKLWEYVSIAQAYDQSALGPDVLGFGVGLDPLAGFFAELGCNVLATDAPFDNANWSSTGQQATSLHHLKDRFKDWKIGDRLTFRQVDMNNIPGDLRQGQFDFLWSCGSLEHIGGYQHSLHFIVSAMDCLKPGGIACHTTEYGWPMHLTPNLCIFDRPFFDDLAGILAERGDMLMPLNLESGPTAEDHTLSTPPEYELPHLKVQVGHCVTTSVVLTIKRGK